MGRPFHHRGRKGKTIVESRKDRARDAAAVGALRRTWGTADRAGRPGPFPIILVVEDNLELLEVLGMLLRYEHYRVALTENGQEAINWLAVQRPALVILDWLLPMVGGDRVLAATRERYGDQVPILVLSALPDPRETLQADADAYIRKPYLIPELVGTIQRLLAA